MVYLFLFCINFYFAIECSSPEQSGRSFNICSRLLRLIGIKTSKDQPPYENLLDPQSRSSCNSDQEWREIVFHHGNPLDPDSEIAKTFSELNQNLQDLKMPVGKK
ncbi:hypothetical protein KBC04_02770 [Candidatus Babeliales bacterium]|nr:hypothetical protein [Candidatus Babeliales bacterium]MBP9844024.1 hypothetical protein [Candidatus Babeliales bacterium]